MIVEISSISTIATLYRNGILKAARMTPRYPASAQLNNKISIYQGDITHLKVDSIVNAANNALGDGSGVNGAIHMSAGPDLDRECMKLNGCSTGDAKITKGYLLPASHVIHTVGPVYYGHDPQEAERLLKSCYSRSLEVAMENGLHSIAFSSISTGIFGYPIQSAASVAISTVREFLDNRPDCELDRVIFVLFSNKDVEIYKKTIPTIFPDCS
ncbi:A1pp-domain-containing protein [Dipodascopsis uninucleata]